MKGSIRFFVGLLLAYGAVGGMDHQPEYFWTQTLTAIVGLAIMASGVLAMNRNSK